jgi:hypothetical protein
MPRRKNFGIEPAAAHNSRFHSDFISSGDMNSATEDFPPAICKTKKKNLAAIVASKIFVLKKYPVFESFLQNLLL